MPSSIRTTGFCRGPDAVRQRPSAAVGPEADVGGEHARELIAVAGAHRAHETLGQVPLLLARARRAQLPRSRPFLRAMK